MSLYFVYTPSINDRRTDYIFYFKNTHCLLKSNKGESNIVFDVHNVDLNTYKQVVSFAEHNKLNAYEILLDKSVLQELFIYFSNYLLDKDISIGLLTTDIDLIEQNQSLLDTYGITTSNIYSDFALSMVTNASYKPRPIKDARDINGGLIDGLPHSRFSPIENSKRSNGIRLKTASIIKLDESFHEKFIKLLIESKKDNAEIYKKAGITRQVFSKIVSNKDMIPTKMTLISLCIGLELSLTESKELIVSAGYSLSRSIMLDVIVMKYIKEGIYDLSLINNELYEYGCPLLGWHPRDE